MEQRTRRNFLADVGKGMLTASVGTALAADLGISTALAEDHVSALEFGRLEPLVALMQENSAEQMLPRVVEHLAKGTPLRSIVAAAALANARTFGGEDYVGFHAFMALAPAYEMTRQGPADRRALPVLKVLYRSTQQIQSKGARQNEVLHPLTATPLPPTEARTDALRAAMRHQDMEQAENIFAGIAAHSNADAFNAVQALVQDDADVHRVVLAYRAWDLLGLTGKAHAHTTLRQSVRFCVATERNRAAHGYPEPGIRAVLPRVLDRHKLVGRTLGTRSGDDAWISALCATLLASSPAQAADAVGGALAEGFSSACVGEALSLAATQQVLRDPGRVATQASPGKPVGSVHGDSAGVHASDSMNAWRNIARASDPYNAVAGLVVAGYHLASGGNRDWTRLVPYPLPEHRSAIKNSDASTLLRELEGAIHDKDQARASALVRQYGACGHGVPPVFTLLRNYAISEDGALHAEKYFHTVTEEFARTRPAYRWEHVTALARVTASEYGKRADGYEQACGLLGVKA